MAFNENTRVKIPAILHLCRLGYGYRSLVNAKIDTKTNIFLDIFEESILRINPGMDSAGVTRLLEDINLWLDYEDLGQEFYKKLVGPSDIKLIDFNNFENNSFHVVTELPCRNGEEEFRPDITLLINGMPLAFIEVKKPNNAEGILAERIRINSRFKNKKFRKFINISQLLVFSNNMEYDNEAVEPIQGAFYSSTSYSSARFNCFREEEEFDDEKIFPEDDKLEDFILKDNNLSTIKFSPEFLTNKAVDTPTNRILTSLFSKERMAWLLKYSIAYVNGEKGIEKHIMRYPQFFATKAIENKLDKKVKKGIIWHTQGSGKTALAYYNVHYLTDYYQRQQIIPKFYFIVDRIDLLEQAKNEFESRGLIVHTVNSKEELLKDFRSNLAIHSLTGKREISVVNIQKFKEETSLLKKKDYDINIQRVYFLDEVHRSYDPKGSFLANLFTSDKEAVMIGLTGTPLIGKDKSSKAIFGDYIHKYYYNASIADGYTLRLIREGIETSYRIQLAEALKSIEILKGDLDKSEIYAHEKFTEPMLDYIVGDFLRSRMRFGDDSIGGMVVCDSAPQARKLYEIFINKYNPEQATIEPVAAYKAAADQDKEFKAYKLRTKKDITSSLILHDSGTKEERKRAVTDFKEGKIDFLFVYNMLLTGFDAHRLKKLYIGRIIRDHNLLQTLTRVNRPYRNFKYGFVVDFADIRKEFDETNKAYFDELQQELGDEMKTYSNLFKTKEEIESEIEDIKEKLFSFDLQNAEIFSQQISEISDRGKMLEIKKALENARNLYNLIRLSGNDELLDLIDFKKLSLLYNEASRHLDLLNLKESISHNGDSTNLLNIALENIIFKFQKISESELIIADQLKEMLRKTREALAGNFDHKDPEFTSLYDELKRLFEKKNLDEISQEDMKRNIGSLRQILSKVNELNRRNNNLRMKYNNDPKFARMHKRILEKGTISKKELSIHEALMDVKTSADTAVIKNSGLLKADSYFGGMMMKMVIDNFDKAKITLDPDSAKYINTLITKEYINEYQGVY